ncbi:MAG: hypothetical protein EA397_03915 [Deltaproteobacteria bacterium]|nr:MAG: hypothetical protein EA397_03915 [Deltaproteobacteria bacterium]
MSTSDIVRALHESFYDIPSPEQPLMRTGRDESELAWAWVEPIVRLRSDWRSCVGVALQHAVAEGGLTARIAFTDMLITHRAISLLLPWTNIVGMRYPEARPSQRGSFATQIDDPVLADVLREHHRYLSLWTPLDQVVLGDSSQTHTLVKIDGQNTLQDVLRSSGRAGHFQLTAWADGAWSWLMEYAVFVPELGERLPALFQEVVGADPEVAPAALDFLAQEWDLWRFEDLLDEWTTETAAWLETPLHRKPAGWRSRPLCSRSFPRANTYGDVVRALRGRARRNAQMRPRMDLEALTLDDFPPV